ncbi:MAG: hypothetical protein GY749_44040 [Desulfobacteraceae bacterium]|nr:hypothetical protein [Desulfobacteraceae bacterium]
MSKHETDQTAKWEVPGEEELFWQMEGNHYPDPVTPADFSILIKTIYGEKTDNYDMPGKMNTRHINTYLYYAHIFEGTPEESDAQHKRFMENVTDAMENMDEVWEEKRLPEIKKYLEQWESYDLKGASVPALSDHLDETYRNLDRSWEVHHLLTTPALMAMSRFDDFFNDLFAEAGQTDAFELMAMAESETIPVENDRALWKLSRQALALPAVHEILTGNDAGDVIAKLTASSQAQSFLADLNNYLQKYGKSCYKLILSMPSWAEDPTPVIRTLQDYVTRPEGDPAARLKKSGEQRKKRLAEIREMLQNYPGPVAEEFESSLKAAQRGSALMSNHYYWIDDQVTYQVRRVLLEFGRRLAEKGCIEKTDDVFYLYLDELKETAKKLPVPTDHRLLINERREAEKRFAECDPPSFLGTMPSVPPPDNPFMRMLMKFFSGPAIPASPDSPPDELKGSAGSPGSVTGTARVIRELSDAENLNPGDILVTSFTLPSWTPFFSKIAGAVTDNGGILSHCAIVAREYAIPAVVGTGSATSVIKDGQTIEVDGNRGIVRIV